MDYMPNASGFSTVGPTGKKPHNVTTLYPRSIIVGSRQRELNPDRVRELAMSIKQNGQLQPIGVREEKTKKNGSIATKYRLIFGAHRLAALCLLEDEGLEQNVTVWTTIYPSTYPDNWIKMNELVENLHRLELTPSERSAQTTSYAGWCKKLGLVQKADTNRSMRQVDARVPHDAAHVTATRLPTVTEKLVNELGIDRDTIARRHATSIQLAEREGMKIEGKKSLEVLDADTLIALGEKAQDAARRKKEVAKATGVKELRVNQLQPRKPTVTQVELDVVDLPQKLVNWCRRRIKDTDYPLTLEVLKETHRVLGGLISEMEA